MRGWQRWALTAVVTAAAGLALFWVFRVPIYQSPDEPAHFDYALSLCERRGLFRPEEVPLVPYENGWCHCGHPLTRYLQRRAETVRIAFHPEQKVAPDYGTREYYRALAQGAPAVLPGEIQAPLLANTYPWGYYALVAAWVGLVRVFTTNLVVVFFAARLLSVLLLCGTLLLVHATLRELRFRPGAALALTALVGFFPLTTFIASYVQPDNLSFALVSLVFYLAVRAGRQPDRPAVTAWLGVALAALLMTKAHHFVCVAVPVLARLGTRAGGGRLRALARAVAPSVLVAAAAAPWTAWGFGYYHEQMTAGRDASPVRACEGVLKALANYYAGTTHDSFWGTFGWMDTPLVIGAPRTHAFIRLLLQMAAWLVFGLTLVRLEQVGSRLLVLTGRGRRRLAVRLACSDPLLNSYFLFTIAMVWLYVRSDNFFAAQGRNWVPFLLPTFLTGLVYAPRALTLRAGRRACSGLLAAGLAAYVLLGSCYGPHVLRQRFYPSPPDPRGGQVSRTEILLGLPALHGVCPAGGVVGY